MNTTPFTYQSNDDIELPHLDSFVYNFNCSDASYHQNLRNQLPFLKLGSIGKAVAELQQTLQMLRYLKGSLDGVYGRNTLEAVKKFQIIYHLAVDGIVGRKTWKALQKAIKKPKEENYPTLQLGNENDIVKELKRKLQSLGYMKNEATGVFCEETKESVKEFQKWNRLVIDGIVGENTWKVLNDLFLSAEVSLYKFEEPITQGVFGEAIKVLQRKLKNVGYYHGDINGHFSYETTKAVTEFQKDNHLTTTGNLDQDTWKTLLDVTNQSKRNSNVNVQIKQHATLQKHIIQNGDTLDSIAQTYHTTVENLKKYNALTSNQIIVGKPIIVNIKS